MVQLFWALLLILSQKENDKLLDLSFYTLTVFRFFLAFAHCAFERLYLLHCEKMSVYSRIHLVKKWNSLNRSTLKRGPGLHYSVDFRIQTFTEPVPLKYGKLDHHKISVDIRTFLTACHFDASPCSCCAVLVQALGWWPAANTTS